MRKTRLRYQLSSLVCALVVLASFCLPSLRSADAAQPQIGDSKSSAIAERDFPNSVPGEVIVKFRSQAALKAALTANRAFANLQTQSLASGAGIEAILKKHGVREAVPLFSPTQIEKGLAIASTQAASAHEALDSFGRIAKFVSSKKSLEGTRALLVDLSQVAEVEYAVPNLIYQLEALPNDPLYASSGSWGQGYEDMWGLRSINAEQAWDVSQGEGVVVAVVDSGVDYKHEDIQENVWNNAGEVGRDSSGRDKSNNGVDDDNNGYVDDWRGWHFPDPGSTKEDNNPMDDNTHGTHVSGTIAAVGNNGKGVIGVAPRAKIMALKAFSAGGMGTSESISKAIFYAANNGAKVINASFGGLRSLPDLIEEEAIDFAVDVKGVVFVAAAGNANQAVERREAAQGGTEGPIRFFVPAAFEKAITVAACDHLDQRAYFSNFGSKIDVAAPGGGDQDTSTQIFKPDVSILSLISSKVNSGTKKNLENLIIGDKYVRLAGTSMSAPHVVGVAALILSKNPHFTVEQVRQAIRLGADDAGAPGFDLQTGYGRLNAARSLAIDDPPAPSINNIRNSQDGAGINVSGSIAAQNFARWTLEYGESEFGNIPATWAEIATSTDTASNALLPLWNTGSVPDGVYTLRLRVEDKQGRQLDDRTRVGIKGGRLAPISFSFELDIFNDTVEAEDANRVKTKMKHAVRVQMFFPSFKISKIALYENGQRVGEFGRTDIANEVSWTPGPVGETELTVVVEGQNGDKFVSDPKRIKILPNAPPDMLLHHASWPEQESGNNGLTIHLKLSDPDGKKGKKPSIKGLKVDVYNFDSLIGSGSVFPLRGLNPNAPDFWYVWGEVNGNNRMPAGTYSIRVVATDKDGYTTRLKTMNFIVKPPQ